MPDFLTPRQRSVTVRQEGTSVLIFVDGQLVLDIPWDGALELSKALHIQAKRAEELAKAPQIVADQAILMRAGWPFAALSARRDIIEEAGKEAAWNSDLRRYMANNLDPSGTVYPLTVIQKEPKVK
jgi:hypothetical protein